MTNLEDLQNLAVATAIGFIIGFQREWRDVEQAKSHTFAGARTFALVGLVGGVCGLLAGPSLLLVAIGLVAIGGLAIVAYWSQARSTPGTGGTTEVALLGTFLLGALAARGEALAASAAGVIIAILLALKPMVQRWAHSMDAREINAALRFLAITVIILPILPNQGYGPYEALNPRRIWELVVLISGLSFLGYWLTKLYGARGILLTGIVGGLASSTATTLSLSRLVERGSTSAKAGAAGIIAANVVMLARMAALLSVMSMNALEAIWPALAAGAVAGILAAVFFWGREEARGAAVTLGNPMELKPALFFAALLAFVSIVSRAANAEFGTKGVLAVAFATGLADVDSITLTAGAQARTGSLLAQTAGAAALIAAFANIIVKGALAQMIAGSKTGWRVAAGFALVVASGAAAYFLA